MNGHVLMQCANEQCGFRANITDIYHTSFFTSGYEELPTLVGAPSANPCPFIRLVHRRAVSHRWWLIVDNVYPHILPLGQDSGMDVMSRLSAYETGLLADLSGETGVMGVIEWLCTQFEWGLVTRLAAVIKFNSMARRMGKQSCSFHGQLATELKALAICQLTCTEDEDDRFIGLVIAVLALAEKKHAYKMLWYFKPLGTLQAQQCLHQINWKN
ncbi:uncharacterized protein F5147DRAFT_651240 [Suillus discolor]|uniref:Uncharacterized protein n=1 Tax=Suillus discolor TaxID=1912936 RepID=A0A9P7FB37_9AGAM|nr:uncharacterized protein F5147DRAFT_651240 [Suillus discolor]KAG2111577.1 hypothetical protein F5147DRAFT_651240 [Suillus discolor]